MSATCADKSPLSTGLVADGKKPNLVAFDINMDTGKIVVTFDEPVKASSFKPAELTIQNAAPASTGSSYKLNGGTKSTTNGLEVSVVMTVTDLNAIKNKAMATGKGDTYMTLTADAVADMNSNKVTAVADKDGKPASAFVSDTRKPSLSSFTLDMTSGELAMTFSETVVPAKMVSTELTLQSGGNRATDANLFYKLQKDGTVSPSESTIVTLILAVEDMDALKALPKLAFSKPSTFLALTDKAITDVSKNPVEAKAPQAALQVSTHTGDVTKPVLEAFSVDLDAGTLSLTFSETVKASSVVPTEIFLQSGADSGVVGTEKYRLNGEKSKTGTDSTVVTITMLPTDQDVIKANTKLLTKADDSFIHVTDKAAKDMSDNTVDVVPTAKALKIATPPTKDATKPKVDSFNLDINGGTLTLAISEPVLTPVDVTKLSLFSADTTVSFALTKKSTAKISDDSKTITITVHSDDLNVIKSKAPLATKQAETVLSLTEDFVKDAADNKITPIQTSDKSTPKTFTEDKTAPKLESYTINPNTYEVTLTFSESVDIDPFNAGSITIASGQTSRRRATVVSVKLSGGTVDKTKSSLNTVVFKILPIDMNKIFADTKLGTSDTNTFLFHDSTMVKDMKGLAIVEIKSDDALKTQSLGIDTTKPTVSAVALDMDKLTLTITFSETVKISTFAMTTLKIESQANGGAVVEIKAGTSSVKDDPVVTLALDPLDADKIKKDITLGTKKEDSFLRVQAGTVKDMKDNVLDAPSTAVTVGTYVADKTPPALVSVGFDMNAAAARATVELVFSETVDADTIELGKFRFLKAGTSTTAVALLDAETTATTVDSTKIKLTLSKDSTNKLKLETTTAVSKDSVILEVDGGGIKDMKGIAINKGKLGKAVVFVADATKPELDSFALDMDKGTIELVFSEAVDVNEFEVKELTLQGQNNGGPSVSLEGSTTKSVNGVKVLATLPVNVLNAIKTQEALATKDTDTYLSFTAGAIKDMKGNALVGKDQLAMR